MVRDSNGENNTIIDNYCGDPGETTFHPDTSGAIILSLISATGVVTLVGFSIIFLKKRKKR